MSRSYEMTVKIRGAAPDRVEAVEEAAEGEWGVFIDWYPLGIPGNPQDFSSSAQGNLCAGETDEEFAERLTKAIWKANGRYCAVEVRSLYLEEQPYDTYSFDEDRYEELVGPPSDGPGPDPTQP